MCKILCVGDPHFNENNKSITDKLHIKIIKNIRKYTPHAVVIMGDLLHLHNVSKMQSYKRAIDFISDIDDVTKELGSQLFLLIGNHDRQNNKDYLSDIHFFAPLKRWNTIHIIDNVQCHKIQKHNFTFVPYVEMGRFYEALNTINDTSSTTAIFCHQDFACCNPHGEQWDLNGPYIISGHIHDYYHTDNLWYVGACYQTISSEDINKSLSLFTFEDNNINEKRIYLKLTNKIIDKIHIDDLDKYNNYKKYNNYSDIVLQISLDSDDIISLRSHTKYIKLSKLGIRIKEKYTDDPVIKRKKKVISSFKNILLQELNKEEFILANKYLSLN